MKSEDRGVQFRKVALIGVGLLGGSIGMALKKRRLARSVVGFVRRRASIRECQAAGAVDSATLELKEAVRGAELIILCTPIGQMRKLFEQMAPFVQKGAIITDVGSVKTSVVRDLEAITAKAGAHFVGSHPMAGGEQTGVHAARPDLFCGAVCVVTPTPKSSPVALRKIEAFWKSLGSKVLRLSPALHDKFVSNSSHLPYVVASALAYHVLSPGEPKQQRELCATGFRDTTRISSGSPEMWRDIALANRKNLLRSTESFMKEIALFHDRLQRGNDKEILALLQEAKSRRDRWKATHRLAAPE